VSAILIWGLALLGLALVLGVLEVFVPTGGILGAVSLCIAAAGVVCLFRESFEWGAAGLAAVLVIAPLGIWFGVTIMPSTAIGRKLILGGEPADEVSQLARAAAAEPYRHLRGQTGLAITDLRPVGTVRFGSEKVDVLSEAGIVAAGTTVRVTHVQGFEIKVRAVDEA